MDAYLYLHILHDREKRVIIDISTKWFMAKGIVEKIINKINNREIEWSEMLK